MSSRKSPEIKLMIPSRTNSDPYISTSPFHHHTHLTTLESNRIDFESPFLKEQHYNRQKSPKNHSDPHKLEISDNTASISSLGLLAFGFPGLLLNLSHIGLFKMNGFVLGMLFGYGGFGQTICGIMEWKKNNSLSAIIFISFGCLCFSGFAGEVCIANGMLPGDRISVGVNAFLWGMLLFVCFLGWINTNLVTNISLLSGTIGYFLIAANNWKGEDSNLLKFGGGFGIICSSLAIYSGFAGMINENLKMNLVPLGKGVGAIMLKKKLSKY